MIPKLDEKTKAIELRKQGLSYNEILERIYVAKSTLSLWLREYGLSRRQKQRLTEKKLAAAKRGGLAKKNNRIKAEIEIKKLAARDITELNDYELMLVGTALYWAEGSKQKEHRPSVGVVFSNSDLDMLKVFLRFLQRICNIGENEIIFEIFIHQSADHIDAQRWWSDRLNISLDKLQRIYFKRNSTKRTYRKNVGSEYHGQLRIWVRNSVNLNRKIAGWTSGIVQKILKKSDA